MNTFRILWIILCCLLLAFRLAAQCDHVTDSKQRFEAMRILPPVTVRAFNGLTIEATYQDKDSVNAVSFDVNKGTVIPNDFSKTWKQGKWWMIFDSCDGKYLYVVAPVLREQFK